MFIYKLRGILVSNEVTCNCLQFLHINMNKSHKNKVNETMMQNMMIIGEGIK